MAKARALVHKIPDVIKQTRHSTTFSLQSVAHPQNLLEDAAHGHLTSDPSHPGMADIPGPRSIPGIGAMWQYLPGGRFYGLDLNQAILKLRSMYGDVVREEIVPGLNLIRLFDPNDFADVYRAEGECPQRVLFGLLSRYNDVYNEGVQGLLTSQGSDWKRRRCEVQQPILQPKSVTTHAQQHVNIANDFVERIAKQAGKSGNIPDFLPEIYKYVTEAVGTVCFDKRLGLLDDHNVEGSRFIHAVGEILTLTQMELRLLPLYRYVNTPTFTRFTKAQNLIRQLSTRCMQQAVETSETSQASGHLVRHLLFSTNLTQREISTFLSEFFAAGVDTTGHYLAFTLYALAKNHQVQEKLYQELKDLTDDEIASGALETTPYLRAFLKESLRMYPVAPGLGRTLQTDAVLAGYRVPAGTNIVMQYDMAGKDSRFISNPEVFQPERWNRDNREKISAYLTLPFGFGPRSCPGRRLAAQEVGIAIAKILQKFHVAYNGGDLRIKMQILNTPDHPLDFTFYPRPSTV